MGKKKTLLYCAIALLLMIPLVVVIGRTLAFNKFWNILKIEILRKFFERARTMILQDGNANAVKEKLKSMEFVTKRSLERLEESDELEL